MRDYTENAEFVSDDAPESPKPNGTGAALERLIREISSESVSEDRVRQIVQAHMGEALTADKVKAIFAESLSRAVDSIPPKTITVDFGKVRTSFDGQYLHPQFERVLKTLAAGGFPLLIGPAGSGKSTIAKQAAKAMDVPFWSQGPASSEFKYLGFVDGHGNVIRTPCREAYENGGLFCAEEIDASHPNALVAGLNMVLGNGAADFANEIVQRHEKFAAIATANTWGAGATREYVGRNALDAATLDRFQPIVIDYDETLERNVAQHDQWVDFVQAARKAADTLKIRAIISPRASIQGANLLRAGMDKKDVAAQTVWRGMDDATVKKVKDQMKKDKDD